MAEDQAYQLATFSPHVGDKFTLRGADGVQCTVELVEASAHGSHGQRAGDAEETGNFSLVFHAPEASVAAHLPQAIYEFRHASLGTLNLFIVPIGPCSKGTGIAYEAVFAST